ncbi:hypothetical protein F8154_06630 [Alkaliphilus pronyensis]|uniref:Uncharacterized protein n=1 Tax=Alkaliphilus pronyensis TaxID=1482732 RepID=A0A6I0F9J2_9FIRM|nr:hypothetical protein [Alkaliphilus pronyensis]KAB3535454.1 hypothetical protein F8154_06630 [Alkaliphilus pronyensis]
MLKEKGNHTRFIALLLGMALIAPLFIYAVDMPNIKDTLPLQGETVKAVNQEEENRIAAEISNLTGVKTSIIHDLRKEGNSWNKILSYLGEADLVEEPVNRDTQLLNSGLTNEFLTALFAEGFREEEVLEAKILAERVQFQLYEIKRTIETDVMAEIESNNENQEENKRLRQLYEGFKLEDAITLVLRLDKRLGSKEAALEEYLISLQLDIYLKDYVELWEDYLDLKGEKGVGIDPITLHDLEEVTLKTIQEGNNHDISLESFSPKEVEIPVFNHSKESPISSNQVVKPHNPAQQIMDEINKLNPNYTTKER